ncbi:MAG: right-handed parallel beta-helix repeat-containing protein [Planctomycetaceae bacterium]|nr:right-handed parallel beta-helix repeat-containing protein [Planctomycetaceae bacterium]
MTKSTGVWLTFGMTLLAAASPIPAADPPVFDVTEQGANLSDDQPDDDAFSKCLQAAIEKGGICRIGPGTLSLTTYPAELRQNGQITQNRDLNGLVIEGAGEEETTIHGTSARGFDVLQLNGVANLTIRNLTITAVKTTKDETQGVNGISMTNGTANVLVEHVTVRKLPYVLKPGRFDGGKAFTVQQGTLGAVSTTDIEIRDCHVFDSPIGFGLDADSNQKVLPGQIKVYKNHFERVSLAFSLSFSGKNSGGADIPGFGMEITGNNLVDVTRVMFIGRAPDVVFTDNTVTTNQLPDLPDPIIQTGIPLVIIGGPRAKIENNTFDYKTKVTTFVLIGGASGNANSDKVSFSGNQFTGAAEVGIKALNNGTTNSRFAGNSFSGAAVDRDKTLNEPRLKNTWSAKGKAATKSRK